MSAIQKLSPHLDQFTARIRQAKDDCRLTLDGIADQSGLSASTVSKVVSGTQRDPKLSVAAAFCAVLGLSLDELCGLAAPAQPDEELARRVHALELENAELHGADRAHLESLAAQRPILIGAVASFALSMLTTLALLAYLIGDAMHTNVGLIQNGDLSAPAWAAVLLIVAALGNAAVLIYRIVRHRRA